MSWSDIELVFEMLEQDERIVERDPPLSVLAGDGSINFNNVVFRYAKDEEEKKNTIDGITFDVKGG